MPTLAHCSRLALVAALLAAAAHGQAAPSAAPVGASGQKAAATAPAPGAKPAVSQTVIPRPAVTKPAVTSEHRFVVLLDPAHGGKDPGATLSGPGHPQEKDATLELAQRVRTLLLARNVDPRLTRDSDTSVSYTQRAAMADSLPAAACLRLHATSTGSGVHVFYPLTQFTLNTHTFLDQWSTAYVAPNHDALPLARLLQTALKKAQIPTTLEPGADPVMALERCPAVAVELAPLNGSGSGASSGTGSSGTPPTDSAYQQRVASALAEALANWKQQRTAFNAEAEKYARKAAR
jgi:N-acetylmuramoyl-L-alanine amidase